jgi:hypothetical protein
MIKPTFKLTLNNEYRVVFLTDSERLEVYRMMLDDFDVFFPWLNIRGCGDGFGMSCWSEYWDIAHQEERVRSVGSFELPLSIAYTMLKLAGANVNRYGFTEVYSEGKVNTVKGV